MNNKSISDYVAASMDAALKSDEYKQLFGTRYKFAQDSSSTDDSCSADDPACDPEKDDSCSADDPVCDPEKDDSCSVDDNWLEVEEEPEAEMACGDVPMGTFAALDMAIDGLLTTSAALDSVGMTKGSMYALKLAALVVEAKKAKKMKKDKKKGKSTSSKSTSSSSAKKPTKKPASSSSSSSSSSKPVKKPAKK